MGEFLYCQLDINNICVGAAKLSGEVAEYNYQDNSEFNPVTGITVNKHDFISRMIKVEVYSTAYIGLKYNENGTWVNV